MLETLTFNLAGPVRHDTLDGRDHLVVPTVMIVEGVLNGSQGPLYYPADELEKSVPVWNHKPLVVYHPKSGSACEPAELNKRKIGVILNTKWDAPKLRTESWVDVEASNRVDKRIMETLEASRAVEVSTGVFTHNEASKGVFNGRDYEAIARDYKADHLAVLPDIIGACSIADGAGMLVTNNGKLKQIDEFTRRAIMGYAGLRPPVFNDRSYQDITSELYLLLYPKFGYNFHIEAVFDAFFVYCVDGTMYRMMYKASDKEVVITGEPSEVYRTVTYVTVNGEGVQTVTNQPPSKQESTTMAKKELIDQLIANGGYEEGDRQMLDGFDEAKLTKLAGKITQPTKNNEEKKDPPPILKVDNAEKPVSVDEYVAKAPPAVAEVIRNALAANEQQKAQLIQEITANKANIFTAEHLAQLGIQQLQGIAALARSQQPAQPTVNYSGAWTPPIVGNAGAVADPELAGAGYTPPVMNFKEDAA